MSQPTQQEVTQVIAGYENAAAAAAYADTVVMEMQQNSGDDYIMVWTNQYPAEV